MNPGDIVFADAVISSESAYLVGNHISYGSVTNKLGKRLVSAGSNAGIVKSVDIFGYSAAVYVELIAAEIVKLKICRHKSFINFSAHRIPPLRLRAPVFALHYILHYYRNFCNTYKLKFSKIS